MRSAGLIRTALPATILVRTWFPARPTRGGIPLFHLFFAGRDQVSGTPSNDASAAARQLQSEDCTMRLWRSRGHCGIDHVSELFTHNRAGVHGGGAHSPNGKETEACPPDPRGPDGARLERAVASTLPHKPSADRRGGRRSAEFAYAVAGLAVHVGAATRATTERYTKQPRAKSPSCHAATVRRRTAHRRRPERPGGHVQLRELVRPQR